MKKNIEIVMLNETSALELLQNSEFQNEPSSRDFYRALKGMLDGSCESILVGIGETPQINNDACIRCGDVCIYPSSRRATRGDKEIILTPKEFDILCLLAKNCGQVFTKEQIYQAVWDDCFIMDNSNVMSFIRKLRKKLEPDPDQPRYILTVWGLGYKFNDNL